MDDEALALTTMWTALICGMLGLILAWSLARLSRRVAAMTAGMLALIGTVAFLISNIVMPNEYNIRVDLLIIPPVLLAAWVSYFILARARKLQ